MPTKIPCHPLNFGTVDAIFINVVSKYSKLDMHYKNETAHSATWWKTEQLAFVSRKRYEKGKKSELQSCRALSI